MDQWYLFHGQLKQPLHERDQINQMTTDNPVIATVISLSRLGGSLLILPLKLIHPLLKKMFSICSLFIFSICSLFHTFNLFIVHPKNNLPKEFPILITLNLRDNACKLELKFEVQKFAMAHPISSKRKQNGIRAGQSSLSQGDRCNSLQ